MSSSYGLIGASGAIIATKAIHELQRIKGRYALATMCIAVIFERV
jgi:acetyl-CoA C-acetyltransferase